MAGVMAAVAVYSMYSANERADQMASGQNASNAAAHDKSVAKAEADAKDRRDELLRRFGVSSGKLADTQQDIERGTAIQLTNLEMELAKANSVTDNAIASRHITGRLAERMNNVIDIQGSLQKGTIVQNAEAQVRDVGNKLETMAMNTETSEMNLDIDLSNAVTAADNQLVSSYSYSQSTGIGGVVASGVSAGMSTYLATKD